MRRTTVSTSRERYLAFCRDRGRATPPRRNNTGSNEAIRGNATEHRSALSAFLRWLRPYRFAIARLFAISAMVAILDMACPLIMRTMVDDVLLPHLKEPRTSLSALNLLGVMFLAAIVVSQGLDAMRLYQQGQLNVRLLHTARRTVFDRLLRLPLHTLSELKIGGILSRLSGDVDKTSGLLQMGLVSPGVALMRLSIGIAMVFWLNWRLACGAILIVPGILYASFILVRQIRPIYRSARDDAAAADARVAEVFGGIRAVRAFARESLERVLYTKGHHTAVRKELLARRKEVLAWSVWGFLQAVVSLIIVWFGGHLVASGKASIGDLMAFQWYVLMLINPVWHIVESFSELQRSLGAADRVFEVLASPPDKPDRPDACTAPPEVHRIEFEEVSFEYRQGTPVLRRVSLTMHGGRMIALVGRSGAGKTTIADLLARFHDPTSGRILLNGTDIRQLRLASYRRLLGVVQQDVLLFDGTVADNIRYGRRGAADLAIAEAARRAHADDFIRELPDGYDTRIGERGIRLSGGQKQRLSIARAILADPKILILDEATSNLDSESEQWIQASLRELFNNRTTLVIAHRLSTVEHADEILVLDEGCLVERGTHGQLMAAGGTYADMVRRQQNSITI